MTSREARPLRAPPRDANEWRQECIYISNLLTKRGKVPEMNYDLATVARYCSVQRDAAEREGFHDSAQYIQHCIDDIPRLRALEIFEWAVTRQSDLGPGLATTCDAFRIKTKELEGIVAAFKDPDRHMALVRVRAPGLTIGRRVEAYYNTSR